MHHPWSQSHNPYNGPCSFSANPTDVLKAIDGNRCFIYTTGMFWFEEDITKDASYGSDGHPAHAMCDKTRKVWDVVPLRQSFCPSNFSDNTIQVRTNTMHTCPPSVLKAPRCSREEMRTPMRGSVLQEEKEVEQMLRGRISSCPYFSQNSSAE